MWIELVPISRTASFGIDGAWRDVEKVLQLCSRVAQRLNVRKRVRLASSLAAASLEGLFEHPATIFTIFLHQLKQSSDCSSAASYLLYGQGRHDVADILPFYHIDH